MRKDYYPIQEAKKLAQKVEKSMNDCIGCLQVLEAFDEQPFDLRADILQVLSTFHSENMGRFFRMVRDEYNVEYKKETTRALKKFKMAGVEIDEGPWFDGKFIVAFCTPTRHTGVCVISVFFKMSTGFFSEEHFVIHFGEGGISDFILASNISNLEIENDIKNVSSLVRLSLFEAKLLLTESYEINRGLLLRPSLGFFLYQSLLLNTNEYTKKDIFDVNRKCTLLYSEKEVVNSLFGCLKNHDIEYALSLFEYEIRDDYIISDFFSWLKIPGVIFLEGKVLRSYKKREFSYVDGYVLIYKENNRLRYDYQFKLKQYLHTHEWVIASVTEEVINEDCIFTGDNPLEKKIYARSYEILEIENLIDRLNDLEQVRKLGELPYGLHLRIIATDNHLLSEGVDLLSGTVADLIVGSEELIILTENPDILDEFNNRFFSCIGGPENYEIDLLTYIRYFQGHFKSLADALKSPEDTMPQDPMRFVTGCYTILNHDAFINYITQKNTIKIGLPDGRTIYYELNEPNVLESFRSEYIVEENILTVSTFSDSEFEIMRKELEKNLVDAVNFDQIEVNPNGFFELLFPDLKGEVPELEEMMKRIYLTRWYNSPCTILEGLSPREAMQSNRGKALIWKMLKWMKVRPSWFSAGSYENIAINDFLKRLQEIN